MGPIAKHRQPLWCCTACLFHRTARAVETKLLLPTPMTDPEVEIQPMVPETRFRDPAAVGQAISLVRADDETRAAEAWTPPSWDQVVREHADRVYRLAYRLCGN